MKRFAIAAAAALTLVGPMASVASAEPQRGNYDRNDRRDNDRSDRNDRGNRNDNRQAQRWNQRQYNGYYANGRFYRGAPPAWAQARSDYRPARQAWRRGERLPSYYQSQYREVDWRRSHYRQPPRGYHYVRDDNSGEVLLVALTTGIILSILASQ